MINPGKTRPDLGKIAAQAKDNWVKIAQQELIQQFYPKRREAQLDQFLTLWQWVAIWIWPARWHRSASVFTALLRN